MDVCHNKCHSGGKTATIRKRGKSWQAQIRLAECPAKSKSFPTKKAAEHWVRIVTHQMLDDKATPPASRHTLATLLERYRDDIVSLKISKTVETQLINRFLTEDFVATPFHQVGKVNVSTYRDKRRQTVKASTLVRELGLLRHCWDIATHENGAERGKIFSAFTTGKFLTLSGGFTCANIIFLR